MSPLVSVESAKLSAYLEDLASMWGEADILEIVSLGRNYGVELGFVEATRHHLCTLGDGCRNYKPYFQDTELRVELLELAQEHAGKILATLCTACVLVSADFQNYFSSIATEGSTDAVSSDSPHVFPRSSRVTRPNLPPDPSVLVKSSEGCRNCSSDAPGVLPLRSGRTALDGSSLVLVGDAGRSRGSGGHLGHAPASCLRGAEAVDLTGNGAGRSRSSGGHLASAPASCLRGADAVDLNGNVARSWGSGGQHALHSHEMVHCSSCLRGSPVDDVEEHNGNAAKNTDGGEQHAQNNHVHAHCSSCLRGAPVIEAVVLNGNAATNLG
ncbi:hypothetical protein Ancab_019510, partial [Ancistrocladus abbreviatus]